VSPIIAQNPTRFIDQFKRLIRSRHYAYKTEKTHIATGVLAFIRFHNLQHPNAMGKTEIELFLEHLSVKNNVRANTQKTALNALIFLFREFLQHDVSNLQGRYVILAGRLGT